MWLVGRKCYNVNNIFIVRFVTSQIRDDRSQRVFFAQMSYVVTSSIIPSLSILDIQRLGGVDSPV